MYDIDFSKDKPLYTTSVVAEMLKVTPDRLRSYDKDKLINTQRVKTGRVSRRLYSQYDVEWLLSIRELVSTHFMSTNSVKSVLTILYLNPTLKLPDDNLGAVYAKLQANPNLQKIFSK